MHLHELADVDARHRQRDHHLDHQLVAGRGGVGRRHQPLVQRLPAGGGDLVALLRPVLRVVGLDEAVPLEALQGRVHLADVERPHLPGAGLELLAELQPVLGAVAQERQQGVPDGHGRDYTR